MSASAEIETERLSLRQFRAEDLAAHRAAVDEVELGYYFGRTAWGRGYATEAGRACLRFYGFDAALYDIGRDEFTGDLN